MSLKENKLILTSSEVIQSWYIIKVGDNVTEIRQMMSKKKISIRGLLVDPILNSPN